MFRRARSRAQGALADAVEAFGRAGCRTLPCPDPLEARLESPAGTLALRLAQQGKVFGGAYALEVSTAAPVLPPTKGLSARGRGVVRLGGVAFRGRGRDPGGALLAERLSADRHLGEALREVHFERIRVEPDGRPVIRHMGGSVVWILFPPLVKAVPLVDAQARATVRALQAFVEAGRERRAAPPR